MPWSFPGPPAKRQGLVDGSLPQSRLHPALGDVQSLLKPSKGDVLAVANRIYVQSGLALLPPFVRTLKSSYGSTVQSVDFKTRFEPARKTINAWVLHQTRRRIRDLLPPGALNALTRMVLVNAIYHRQGGLPWHHDPGTPQDLEGVSPGDL